MPTFDVVSEVDAQEVRNAVDQASRELAQRYDFKGTNSSIELGTNEITLHTSSEDRLTALTQLLEEKPVTWQGSLRAPLTDADVFPKTENGLRAWVGVGGTPRHRSAGEPFAGGWQCKRPSVVT